VEQEYEIKTKDAKIKAQDKNVQESRGEGLREQVD
jgi:hypothetical protein